MKESEKKLTELQDHERELIIAAAYLKAVGFNLLGISLEAETVTLV